MDGSPPPPLPPPPPSSPPMDSTNGSKNMDRKFISNQASYQATTARQLKKDASGANSKSAAAAAQPSHYMNMEAQKAKLILPTALWILLIIAGLCFLTLLASLSRTLGTLDTLVELEQERTDLMQRQHRQQQHHLRTSTSNLFGRNENNNDADYNQHSTLANGGGNKWHNSHHHHHNHFPGFGRKQAAAATTTTSTSTTTARPNNHYRRENEGSSIFDLLFSDEVEQQQVPTSNRLSSSSWFSIPSWTSLEPDRMRFQQQQQQVQKRKKLDNNGGADIIIASIESEPSDSLSSLPSPPSSSLFDSILNQFMPMMLNSPKPMTVLDNGRPLMRETAQQQQLRDNENGAAKISAKIDNLNINFNQPKEKEDEEERESKLKRKSLRSERRDEDQRRQQQQQESIENLVDELMNKLVAADNTLAANTNPIADSSIGNNNNDQSSLLIPMIQSQRPSSPLASFLSIQSQPSLLQPIMMPHHQATSALKQHHHDDKSSAFPTAIPQIQDQIAILASAINDENNDNSDNHVIRASLSNNRFREPYEQYNPLMQMLSSASPSSSSSPQLFTNDGGQITQEHKKFHEKNLPSPGEPTQKDHQDQWHSLSSELANSLLQSFLPTSMNVDSATTTTNLEAAAATTTTTKRPQQQQSISADQLPDAVVIVDGKPLGESESKKFLAKFFEEPSLASSAASTTSTNSPIRKVEDLINMMFAASQTNSPIKNINEHQSTLPTTTAASSEKLRGISEQLDSEQQRTTLTMKDNNQEGPTLITIIPQTTEPTTTTTATVATSPISADSTPATPSITLSNLEPATVIGDLMASMFTMPQFSGSQGEGNSSNGGQSSSGDKNNNPGGSGSSGSSSSSGSNRGQSGQDSGISSGGSAPVMMVSSSSSTPNPLDSTQSMATTAAAATTLSTKQQETTLNPTLMKEDLKTISTLATTGSGSNPTSATNTTTTTMAPTTLKQTSALPIAQTSTSTAATATATSSGVKKGQTAPTIKPKDVTERPLKTFLQRADDFIERSLTSFKHMLQ